MLRKGWARTILSILTGMASVLLAFPTRYSVGSGDGGTSVHLYYFSSSWGFWTNRASQSVNLQPIWDASFESMREETPVSPFFSRTTSSGPAYDLAAGEFAAVCAGAFICLTLWSRSKRTVKASPLGAVGS